MSSRGRDIPAEGSWRLVDGENDSFDTSILPAFSDDDLITPLSSGQPSSGYPTQQLSFSASQDRMSFNSQDSIRDFANHQDDEQVILREPFRPTVPPSMASASGASRPSLYPEPELQLRMPRIDIDSDVSSSMRSTLRNVGDDRARGLDESEGSYPARGRRNQDERQDDMDEPKGRLRSVKGRKKASWFLSSMMRSVLQVVLIFNYIIPPIALLFAGCLLYDSSVLQNISQDSLAASLVPLCSAPGASNLKLPFCKPLDGREVIHTAATYTVDFSDLVDVQSTLEDILAKSFYGITMPLELKRSEMATRSLRSMLKESDIPSKEDLISELNSYIDKVSRAGSDLQTFYIHIGSTMDSVIHINRWTIRHIYSLSVESEESEAPELPTILAWTAWLLSPFKASQETLNDQSLLETYTSHIVLVQERLERLIDEGTTLSMLLYHSQSHLAVIYEHAKHSSSAPIVKSDSLLSSIWAYIGDMMDEQRDLDEQISLLKRVDLQYAGTISHLLAIIEELETIHAGLQGLLKRSAEPPIAWSDEPPPSVGRTTLAEQLYIIKGGVRRLERARKMTSTMTQGAV